MMAVFCGLHAQLEANALIECANDGSVPVPLVMWQYCHALFLNTGIEQQHRMVTLTVSLAW